MAADDESRLRRLLLGDEDLADPDWPTDHVPVSERRGLVSISAVLLGFVFSPGRCSRAPRWGPPSGSDRRFW